MGSSNNFYVKVFNDEKIVNLLNDYNVNNWCSLTNFERKELLRNLIENICCIYHETEGNKVKFVSNNESDGAFYEDTEFLNDTFIDDDNPYIILYTFMHEYRHSLQLVAENMYLKDGTIHDAFSEERIKNIVVNDMVSELDITSNYVESGQFDFYEYFIQPLEYDADKFAYNFMQILKEKVSKEDRDAIDKACYDFEEYKNQIVYSRDEIIDFGRIYKLNYDDYIAANCALIKKENEIADEYFSLLDDLSKLNKNNVFSLFSPCFWRRLDLDKKKILIEKCFEFYGYDFEVTMDSNVYINDEYVPVTDSYEVAERMFTFMGEVELNKILNKEESELNDFEKSIVYNLSEGNMIDVEENPFMYHVQPYMYFMHEFIFNMCKTFYLQQENVFENKGNHLDKYKKLIANHDVEAINKKVKMLTNDNPLSAYMKMIKQKKAYERRKALV